jgi:hypothetical protein
MANNCNLTGPSMEQRIVDRLKPSTHGTPDKVQGEGPTRVATKIHHTGFNHAHSDADNRKPPGGRA